MIPSERHGNFKLKWQPVYSLRFTSYNRLNQDKIISWEIMGFKFFQNYSKGNINIHTYISSAFKIYAI